MSKPRVNAVHRQINATIPAEMNELLSVCQEHGISVSSLIAEALENFLPEIRQKLHVRVMAQRDIPILLAEIKLNK